MSYYNISLTMTMFQKITKILTFLFKSCELQEHATQEKCIVSIRLTENEENKTGLIQLDVYGSWIDHFNIRTFLFDVLQNDKLDFIVQYGSNEADIYYLYSISYNSSKRLVENIITLEEESLVPDSKYYLRFTITTTVPLLKNLFYKLKNYLRIVAPKYPSTEIQFNVSGYSWNQQDMDEKYTKMVAETVGEVMKYSLNYNFRRQIFEVLNVTSKQWAIDELFNKLTLSLPERDDKVT